MKVRVHLPCGRDRDFEDVAVFDASEGELYLFTDDGMQPSMIYARGCWESAARIPDEPLAN